MTNLLVIALLAGAFSAAAQILEPSKGFPGFIVDHFNVSFTPIPLSWADETVNRTLQISFVVRTLDTDGVLFTIDSINEDQFSIILSLYRSKFSLKVRIGHNFVGEYVDEREAIVDESHIVTTLLDIDNKIIRFNGIEYNYEGNNLDHLDNSIDVTFGSDKLGKSCLNMESIIVSGITAKLEPPRQKNRACLVTNSIAHLNEPEKTDNTLPNLINTFSDPRIQDADTLKKIEEIAAQPELLSSPNLGDGTRPNCYPQQLALCGDNSKNCLGTANINNGEDGAPFECHCKDGYNGSRCQFSLLPRTCYEAFALNLAKVNEAGAYELDVDGSGPLRSSWAYCTKNATTLVTHNMPNQTVIRNAIDTADKYFPISYKLFQDSQIKKLIKQSASCRQKVTVDCNYSPLSFATNSTWFVSASSENAMIRQIGETPDACECAATECAGGRQCNCDSLEATSDEGWLNNEQAGLTFVYALHTPYEEPSSMSTITLGPLMCEGSSGSDPTNQITVTSVHGALTKTSELPLTAFEFDFRTIQEDIASLVTFDGDIKVSIGLSKGHLLDVVVENGEAKKTWSVMSQPRLNDLRWHKVVIEVIFDELRVSIDSTHSFNLIEAKLLPSQITLGHIQNAGLGFIGCLRNIAINWNYSPIASWQQSSGLHFKAECPSLCYKNICKQNSRCIEHFETGTTSCKCKNKYVHHGERCEKNLNTNSEVSFHNKEIGFLEYPGTMLPSNPLVSTVVFSMRTDQRRALLIYAHDQSDNFVQVHLSDEYSIYLTLSNYTDDGKAEVLSCGVLSTKFSEFSDMRWLQIVIERSPDRTTLSVDDEQCQILGPIHLAPENMRIADYSSNFAEAIFPPMAKGQTDAPEPYQVLFIGGIRRPPYEAGNLRKKRSRAVFYYTLLPPLLGCMRGFVINGSFVDMRKDGIRPSDPTAVQPRCFTECETIVCNNGGHCTYKWQNKDPSVKELTSCDCSKTSYTGSSCIKDVGVTFDGSNDLIYKFNESHPYDLSNSPQQTIRFAFVPASLPAESGAYRIFTAVFGNGNKLYVSIRPLREGLDRVDVVLTSPQVTLRFDGSFNDGYRHFFQAIFTKQNPPVFIVDAKKQYLNASLPQINLKNVEKFIIGGQSSDRYVYPDGIEPTENNYSGCISGLNIDFHQNRKTEFRPLEKYLNGKDVDGIFINEPDPAQRLQQSQCVGFKVKGIIPSLLRDVEFPQWDAVFKPMNFTPNFTAPVSDNIGPEEPGYSYWVIILVILALLTIFFCCLLILCCRNNNKNDKGDVPIGEGVKPETNSLLESPVDDFKVPPATAPLFYQKNGVDRPPIDDSPSSSLYHQEPPNPKDSITSIYYTAQENLDDDSLDAYAEDDPNDLDRVLAQGFGEERPNIIDRKTANMIEKTNPNRPTSFAAADLEAPPLPKKLTPASVPKVDV